MPLIVMKFGGTSVADTDKIKNVADIAIKEKLKGNKLVIIVSAMGKTTDKLVNLAKEISDYPHAREMDMLLSTGEQVTIALLAMALHHKGHDAVSFTGLQAGILTESVHTKARILKIDTEKIREQLSKGKVVIVAGFQGITEDFEITTLGRGGSDTSAVAIAAALSADMCDIYTDVDGVYTADPRVVPAVKKLDVISYIEMLELASVGAKVLHPRSVEIAKKANISLRVRSTFMPDDEGTLVTGVESMNTYRPVSGVAADLNQVKVVVAGVPDIPGIAAQVFSGLAKENISVDMIIQSLPDDTKCNDIAFTIAKEDLHRANPILGKIKEWVKAKEILVDEDIAKVSIVGAGMIDRPGIAAYMFEALAESTINIKMIATSEIKISCLVPLNDAHKAVRAIHTKFNLDDKVKGALEQVGY